MTLNTMSQSGSPVEEELVNSGTSSYNEPPKIIQIITNITVEPTVFLTMLTSIIYQLIAQNLYLEKACRVDIGLNVSICDALTIRNTSGYTKHQEAQVHKIVSHLIGARTVIISFFPLCLILFVGSWSDRHSRKKPVILIPIIGEIFCCISLILNVIFLHELPTVFTVLGDSLPLALCGGWPSFFIGAYSYVGSRCSNKNRTLRMGAVSSSRLAATSLGFSVAGLLFNSVGFLGIFIVCILLLSVALTLAILLIKEEKTEIQHQKEISFFQDFFDTKYLKNTMEICFKRGSHNRRYKVIIIMCLILVFNGTIQGEFSVKYMYTRFKFGWNAVEFGLFSSAVFSSETLGTFCAIIIFSRMLHYDDSFLGILGLGTSLLGSIAYALAPREDYFRCAIIFDIFRMAPYIAMRSLMSKIVPATELARSNSVFGLCEAIMPFIFGPLYTSIYKYTIDVFPGTFFLVTALIKTFGLCLFAQSFTVSKHTGEQLYLKYTESKFFPRTGFGGGIPKDAYKQISCFLWCLYIDVVRERKRDTRTIGQTLIHA